MKLFIYLLYLYIYNCICINGDILDLLNPPESVISNETESNGVLARLILPTGDIRISCVKYGNELLWKPMDGRGVCVDARLNRNNVGRVLVFLGIVGAGSPGYICLLKKYGIWCRIDNKSYKEFLDEIYSERSLDININITKDDIIFISEKSIYNVNIMNTFITKNAVKLVQIRDGKNIIFNRRTEDELLRIIKIYKRNNEFVLINMLIQNSKDNDNIYLQKLIINGLKLIKINIILKKII